MPVSVKEFEKLSKKVDILNNIIQVCRDNYVSCKEKLNVLEETCEKLKECDKYSILYPDEEDESRNEEQNMESKNMIPDQDEIRVLTNVKEQNSEQIKNLEQRIQSLEEEQSSLKATISVNEESRTKNSSNIESISEKVIILSNDMKKLKEIGSEEASNMRETTSYKCKKRDEAYNEKGRLSQHVKNQHIKTSLKCDLCDQSFFENFQLEDHLLKDHQQMKNFTCKE